MGSTGRAGFARHENYTPAIRSYIEHHRAGAARDLRRRDFTHPNGQVPDRIFGWPVGCNIVPFFFFNILSILNADGSVGNLGGGKRVLASLFCFVLFFLQNRPHDPFSIKKNWEEKTIFFSFKKIAKQKKWVGGGTKGFRPIFLRNEYPTPFSRRNGSSVPFLFFWQKKGVTDDPLVLGLSGLADGIEMEDAELFVLSRSCN